MSALFSSFTLKQATLRNRIAVAPMCQYQAVDGHTNQWHYSHYDALGRGGAGLVVMEATAVSPEGRITPGCTGIWDDAHICGLARVAGHIRAAGSVAGIQIAHAGRKANANRPWEGDDHIPESDPRSWPIVGPSPIAYGGILDRVPCELQHTEIERIQNDFAQGARRAREAGFQWLELHFAHGYLAQSFFSQHSNLRTDRYGGSAENRGRFLLETLAKVRREWPEHLPLTARLGVISFDGRDAQTLEESIELVRRMREGGLDLLSVSMTFAKADLAIPWASPPFMAPLAAQVRQGAGLPVASSWGIDAPEMVESVIRQEQMDIVMIGRAHLGNPYYAYAVACALGQEHAPGLLPTPYRYWLERYRGSASAQAHRAAGSTA